MAPVERPRRADDRARSSATGSTATGGRSRCSRNGGTDESDRAPRVAASRSPLLVTGLVNVRYLTGLQSSNAAVLVEPAGEATLYTDFRYAEAARDVDGVTFHQTPRVRRRRRSPSCSPGRRVAVEAAHLTLASADMLRAGGVELVSTTGLVERPSRRQGAGASSTRCGARARSPTGCTTSSPSSPSSGAPRPSSPGGSSRRGTTRAPTGRPSTGSSRSARTARGRTRSSATSPIPEGTLVVVDAGCSVDGYASDCTRTFFTGEPDGRLREIYDLCLQAQLDGLAAVHPGAVGRDVDAASRVAIEAGRAGGSLRARSRPRRRSRRPRGAEPAARVELRSRSWQRRHGRAGDLPAGDVGVRIEDMVVVTEDGCERLTSGDEGAGRRRLGWTLRSWRTSSTRTSSGTGCTSSTAARCGASSSSST